MPQIHAGSGASLAVALLLAVLMLDPGIAVAQASGQGSSSSPIAAVQTQPLPVTGDPAKDLAASRAALTAGRYEDAIRLLTKMLEQPGGRLAKDARELLGLAREKNGQFAHAEAEYRQYLHDYPDGGDAARVQQRLDGVIALQNKPFEDMHKAAEERQRQADIAAVAAAHAAAVAAATAGTVSVAAPDGWGAGVQPTQLVGPATGAEPATASAWRRSYDGSLGVYYLRNLGSTEIVDPINPGATTRLNQVYQDTITTQIDLRGTISNTSFAGTVALAASQDKSFIADNLDLTRVSQAYLEGDWKDVGFSLKAGRQTRFGGGVLGRFDGMLASYELAPGRRVDFVAGAPVDLTSDGYMLRNRQFFGASYDFKLGDPRWEASLFGIEQLADGALDRRAVGYDLKYTAPNFVLFNSFDYDVSFRQPNIAILTGNYIYADKSALGFDLDFRKSPALFASNAVQGQGTDRLGDLLGRYDYSQIAQYAVDRSADTYTASLNYNRPLNDHLSFYGDLYETYIGPTATSAGVEATPAEGPDTYVNAQLVANGILRDSDLYVNGWTIAHTSTSNQYQVEFGAKFPITEKWRLSPDSKFGYKTFATDGHTEFHFLPSIGFNYAFTRDSSLELDAGGHMTEGFAEPGMSGAPRTWELLLTAGYRYDFYSQ